MPTESTSYFWQQLQSGYAQIKVAGSLFEEQSNFEHVDIPTEVRELQEIIENQTPSYEVNAIATILREEYNILQIIPATSSPVAKLEVQMDITRKTEIQLHIVLSLSFHPATVAFAQSLQTTIETQIAIQHSRTEHERDFQLALRHCLSTAFDTLFHSS